MVQYQSSNPPAPSVPASFGNLSLAMITVSVLIPAFNEERTILTVLEKVAEQTIEGVELDVVVIDDGSTDSTAQLVESNPRPRQRLIRAAVNGGKGAAVIAGLKQLDGDYVLFQDADLEYSPSDYGKLLRPVVEFGADIVMGSRFSAPEYTRVHYYWHRFGNRRLTGLFNVLFNTTFTDVYSCYLLLRRSLINPDELHALGWDQQAEILGLAVPRAKVIYEVPITYRGRTYDEGKKIRAQHGVIVAWQIVKRRFLR